MVLSLVVSAAASKYSSRDGKPKLCTATKDAVATDLWLAIR